MINAAIGKSETVKIDNDKITIYKTDSPLGKYGGKQIAFNHIDQIFIKSINTFDRILIVKMKKGQGPDISVLFNQNLNDFSKIADYINGKIKNSNRILTAVAITAAYISSKNKSNK